MPIKVYATAVDPQQQAAKPGALETKSTAKSPAGPSLVLLWWKGKSANYPEENLRIERWRWR